MRKNNLLYILPILFISKFCWADLAVPLDVLNLNVGGKGGYYYRYIQLMSDACLYLQVFDGRVNKTTGHPNWQQNKPLSELKFCKYNGLDFNDGITDNDFTNMKYGENSFDFDFDYTPLTGTKQKYFHCTAIVVNNKITAPICKDK